jgi:aspartyl-tRNA(Asn)/glutamyl-tRNA(Gln) amidotransferase subunit C
MNSRLDEQQVRHVAHLARLTVSDEEVARFADDLSAVLSYVEQLSELDTAGVSPTAYPLPLINVFREDEIRPSIDPDQALGNAPQRIQNMFRVPKVLDQESGA